MSSVVVSFETGALFEADSGSLEVVAPQPEANIITVKGDLPVSITGGKLDDKITLGGGDATVLGQDGNDMVKGGIGDDAIFGGEGHDTLMGGAGADYIDGGLGDDIIKGGAPGADADEHSLGDILKGGAGDDIFEFVADEFESGATDLIIDFRDGEDTIAIHGVSDRVSYDSRTGIVSVDGDEAIDIGKGLEDVNPTKQGDSDTWKMF